MSVIVIFRLIGGGGEFGRVMNGPWLIGAGGEFGPCYEWAMAHEGGGLIQPML